MKFDPSEIEALATALVGPVAAALASVVADAISRAFAARDTALLTTATAAQLVGRTPAALRMLASRRPDVAAARVGEGRDQRWRRDLLLAALGANGGGR